MTDAAGVDVAVPDGGVIEVAAVPAPDAAAEDTGTPLEPFEDIALPWDLPPDGGAPDASVLPDLAPDVAPDLPPDVAPGEAVEGGPEIEAPPACGSPRPVVFMHGINGSSANWGTIMERLAADGWPAEYLVAVDVEDASWGCNVDNAASIGQAVDTLRAATGQPRVDLVAHSMGTLSSRYYVKNLGGTEVVNSYVTLGGMHHGLISSCFAPDFLNVCVWSEICQWGDFVTQLNEPPATPGELNWVSIYSTSDGTVAAASSQLDGAEMIAFEGVDHDGPNGLLQVEQVYAELKRVLEYECW